MRTEKARKEEILKDWINKVTATKAGNCTVARAEERGLKLVETFESMRVKDLQLAITLACAAFGAGCEMSREWTRKHREMLSEITLVVTVCSPEQYRDVQGIHLLCPDDWYLNDAIHTAERDGFKTIFCHYETNGTAQYKIPYDVLNRLSELAKEKGVKVSYTHPAA